jgi:hypothetical protein
MPRSGQSGQVGPLRLFSGLRGRNYPPQWVQNKRENQYQIVDTQRNPIETLYGSAETHDHIGGYIPMNKKHAIPVSTTNVQ